MKILKLSALLTTLCVALSFSLTTEAKRLGGGGSAGMQRSEAPKGPANAAPAKQATPQAPATPPQAAPTPAAQPAPVAATPPQPQKRSWLGPLAGLAAGIGLAALLSHFGMGEAVANFLMMALLAVAAFFVIRLLISKMRGPQPAAATAGAGADYSPSTPHTLDRTAQPVVEPVMERTAQAATPSAAASGPVSVTGQPLAPLSVSSGTSTSAETPAGTPTLHLPAGFDQAAFERLAKMIFIRLQAANDAGNLDDLRQFTTPELFASIRVDLQDRNGATQTTDVQRVDAQVVDFTTEASQQIVTVRFHGLIKEAPEAAAEAFDELWHLVRPVDESLPWAIAGIQQAQ
jgi:predicted lipid-binding transport protein (Tim44 family)